MAAHLIRTLSGPALRRIGIKTQRFGGSDAVNAMILQPKSLRGRFGLGVAFVFNASRRITPLSGPIPDLEIRAANRDQADKKITKRCGGESRNYESRQ